MRRALLIMVLVGLAGIAHAEMGDWFAVAAVYLVMMFFAVVATIAIELVTSFAYLYFRKLSRSILPSIVLVNIISVPALWLAVQGASGIHASYFFPALFIGEIAIMVFETIMIFGLNRKSIEIPDAAAISVIGNVASSVVGVVVYVLIFVVGVV